MSYAERFLSLRRHFADSGHSIWSHPQGAADSRLGIVRVGFRCNQDCGFCWQGRDWPDAPPDELLPLVDAQAAAGVRVLTFTGGEPTVYKRLPELVRRAHHDHGMTVQLQTNAIAFSSPRSTQRFVEAGVERLFVSFHSADGALSDAMTKAPGTWTRTVAGVENALRAGIDVHLNCVVEARNAPGLGEHAAFIVKRFCAPFGGEGVRHVSYSQPSRYLNEDDWRGAVPHLDTVAPHLTRAARTLRAAGVAVDLLGTCGFPACALRDAPELLAELRPEDYPDHDTSSRRYGEVCERCSWRSRCLGLRNEYVDEWGTAGIVPFDQEA